MSGYRFELWRYGFLAQGRDNPFAGLLALLRSRAVEPDRGALLASIRTLLEDVA